MSSTVYTGTSRADRPTSFHLQDIDIPKGREEDWRFTPIERIATLLSDELSGQAPQVQAQAPEYVSVSNTKGPGVGDIAAPSDRAAVVSWNSAKQFVRCTVPANTVVEEIIRLDIQGTHDTPSAQHVYVEVGACSSATVELVHTGEATLNQTVEIDVHDGAQLTLVSTQEWDANAIHASNHRIRVGKDSKITHGIVSLGGDVVRICTDVFFSGEGADVNLLGAYFTEAGQHQEHRLFVAHTTPHCVSRVAYKGALRGQDAHSVWVGDVLIGADAFGTDTYELNRNLLLSLGPKADSVPNLEIKNGEILGAGHASTTGRFDDEQLFYLQARGIDPETARRLVVHGFFAEVLAQIGVSQIRERLMEVIDRELESGEQL